MAVTENDLRIELGFDEDEWTAGDAARATRILTGARRVVVGWAGRGRVRQAEVDAASDIDEIAALGQSRLDALDEAVLEYAKPRFGNPERVMQRREGSDNSVSFADSSAAATGRSEVMAILGGAFGSRAGTTTT